MQIVIFGLTVSSSWGNGHATLWRSLIEALDRDGHDIVFFEQDTPYYRVHRDRPELGGRARLVLYATWDAVRREALEVTQSADVVIVTSYCPDGRAACELVLGSRAELKVFYDLDTPVTLDRLASGEDVPYLPERGLRDFDLVLSFTGGQAIELLQSRLGARRVAPLYGSVDPDHHRPTPPISSWASACSYLGTWSQDRERGVDALFLEPARRHAASFVIGGSLYPPTTTWPSNIIRVDHVPPSDHSAFYCSSPITVNVTRRAMASLGYCPSGRLFEAAACGVPVLSDSWEGLEEFFTPGEDILLANDSEAALEAIKLPRGDLQKIGRRARQRTLDEHTGTRRAAELIEILETTGGAS
jgi:spore maturation protein CgeB